jgi:hypothetical protein
MKTEFHDSMHCPECGGTLNVTVKGPDLENDPSNITDVTVTMGEGCSCAGGCDTDGLAAQIKSGLENPEEFFSSRTTTSMIMIISTGDCDNCSDVTCEKHPDYNPDIAGGPIGPIGEA